MLPVNIKERIDRYVQQGVPLGGFLSAVLANDLFAAVTKADDDNLLNLESIVRYVYDVSPSTCHGTYAAIAKWLKLLAKYGNDLNDVPMSER